MSEVSEFAVKILKEYADGEHISQRHTVDLSPLEGWLISKLFTVQNGLDFNVKENLNIIRQLGDKVLSGQSKDQQIKELTELSDSAQELIKLLVWLLEPIYVPTDSNQSKYKDYNEKLKSYQQKYPKPQIA